MAQKSYGTLLKKGAVTVGEIVTVAIPEIVAETTEVTNHSSGGWRQFIPSGLKSLSEFELTVIATGSLVTSLFADMSSELVTSYTIAYPTTTSGSLTNWTFLAIPVSVKVSDAKADSPDAATLVVKFQPSGSVVIA
jgi:hypothetical protein